MHHLAPVFLWNIDSSLLGSRSNRRHLPTDLRHFRWNRDVHLSGEKTLKNLHFLLDKPFSTCYIDYTPSHWRQYEKRRNSGNLIILDRVHRGRNRIAVISSDHGRTCTRDIPRRIHGFNFFCKINLTNLFNRVTLYTQQPQIRRLHDLLT